VLGAGFVALFGYRWRQRAPRRSSLRPDDVRGQARPRGRRAVHIGGMAKPARERKQPIETAPRDGSWITVLPGRDQEPAEAHWNRTFQGWCDHEMRVLHMVSHWRPERRN
jgi:hypothetical protein